RHHRPPFFVPDDTLLHLTGRVHGNIFTEWYRFTASLHTEPVHGCPPCRGKICWRAKGAWVMSGKLKGRVAIVTGASKGVGADIAHHLAAEGAAVAVNYASSKGGADRVVAEITAKGGKAIAIQADVAKQADVRRLFAETKRAFGPPDILVNNAGIYE